MKADTMPPSARPSRHLNSQAGNDPAPARARTPANLKPVNPFFRWLGGIPLTLGLLFTFAVAIATATFIEAKLGTPAARALVYGAHWFEALLALLVVNLIVSLFIHMPYRIAQLGFVITHISFIVVLVSAGITRFFGFEGTMHIREGQSSNVLVSNEPHVLLQMGEEKGSFVVPLYHPTSAHGSVHLGTETYRVDVREFWPHYEERLFSGGDGPPAAHFVFSAGDDVEHPTFNKLHPTFNRLHPHIISSTPHLIISTPHLIRSTHI